MNLKQPIQIVASVIFIFALGTFFGYSQKPDSFFVKTVSGKEHTALVSNADFEIFWTAWKKLDEKFPDAKEISTQDRIYGAIKGLAYSFKDPYTDFLVPDEFKSLNEDLRGDLVGIGVEIDTKDGLPRVLAPLEGSPAEKAGVLSGDIILEVDDVTTEKLSLEEVISKIRGEAGTTVKILVINEKDKKQRSITITRAVIKVPTLKTETKDGVFIIHLYNFYDNSVPDFNNAMKKYNESALDKLVIDVRGNPGGYLDSSIKIASWFLPTDEVIVREKFAEGKEEQNYRSTGLNSLITKKPTIAILVDNGSASASEILSGALRERAGAKLFGEQTYGKGSVQEVIDMPNKTALKITVAKWLTPEGISISDTGLKPDFEVLDNKETEADEILLEAIEYLNKK
jgi:carboxyl-terminal processing protease